MRVQLPHIIVLTGPTASGKSSVAMEIARHFPAEIISADSRQIFRRLTIGTAKPSPDELKEVPHHLIDIREPGEVFNAGEFLDHATKLIAEISARGKMALVVGGTGLYIRVLLHGLFTGPGRIPEIRQSLEEKLHREGSESLLADLRKIDPEASLRMLPTNTRRIIRALEVYYGTGKTITRHHQEQVYEPQFIPSVFALQWQRDKLYRRINERVDEMLHSGLLDEVRALMVVGYDLTYQSMQTVGYKEALMHITGELSHEDMRALMQQNTRRFAKRQMTWFRRENMIEWIEMDESHQVVDIASMILRRHREIGALSTK